MYWAVGPDRPAARQSEILIVFCYINDIIVGAYRCEALRVFSYGADILFTF